MREFEEVLSQHGEERMPEKTSDLEDEAEAALRLGERVLGFPFIFLPPHV